MATKKRSYINNSLKKRTYRKKSYRKKSHRKNKKSKRNKKRRMKGGSKGELTEMKKLKLKYLEEQDRVKEINIKIQQKLNTITMLNEMGVTEHNEFLEGEIEELNIEIRAGETPENKTKISDLKNLLQIHKWQSRQLLKACDYDYNKAIHLGLTFMIHGSSATQENLDNIKQEYDPTTAEGMETIKTSVQMKGVELKRQKAEEEKKEAEAARAEEQLFESIKEILGNYMEDLEIRKFIEANKGLPEELIREQAISEFNIREFLYRVSKSNKVDDTGRSLAQYYLSKSDSFEGAVKEALTAGTRPSSVTTTSPGAFRPNSTIITGKKGTVGVW